MVRPVIAFVYCDKLFRDQVVVIIAMHVLLCAPVQAILRTLLTPDQNNIFMLAKEQGL